MYRLCFLFLSGAFSLMCHAQLKLSYEENQTLEYASVIKAYEELDSQYSNAKLQIVGVSDAGRNIYTFQIFGKKQSRLSEQLRILINNGIHPGESCGIDASLEFSRDLLQKGVPDGVEVTIIPIYNIGGALNRNCCSRTNQIGPEEHGFRGNARNLDLNRDFIKADALNTLSFYDIFHEVQPHIFVDTHTSNGADYQYVMTLISTQKDKLNPVLSDFLTSEMEPALYDGMKSKGFEMIPYVNVFGSTPDMGYAAFLETPRYASGYTALFNTLGFITEAHMLKPYAQRVKATLEFLNVLLNFSLQNKDEIISLREKAFKLDVESREWAIDWQLDSGNVQKISFKGYEYSYLNSNIGNYKRLKYHQDQPRTYELNYYNSYKAVAKATSPAYYIVPAAWRQVPELLRRNKVEFMLLEKDSLMEVNSFYINDFDFVDSPYEGHFPLRSLDGEWKQDKRTFLKGDLLVPVNQKNKRFIMAVLEPEAVDSYLRWNFYDEIFQQKEWFSAYVFEDEAEELLKNDPLLNRDFEEWKKQNPEQAKSAFMSLYFIFKRSLHYEKEHLRYPVGRSLQ